MLDLRVGTAERSGRVRPQRAIEDGQQLLLLGSFVRQQLGLQPVHQPRVAARSGWMAAELVGDRTDLLDQGPDARVLCVQRAGDGEVGRGQRDGVGTGRAAARSTRWRWRATSITSCRMAPAVGGSSPAAAGEHGRHATGHADGTAHRAMRRAAAGDEYRVGQAVHPVSGEHDVGGLGRRGRPARGQRHSHAGGRQRRGIVHAVTHHDRRAWTPVRRCTIASFSAGSRSA